MRKNFGVKTWVYPQPVFIVATYNDDGTENAMTAAWGGISEENEITICIDGSHKTADNLLRRKAFTVSMGEEGMLATCDFVGIESGNNCNEKFKKAGFSGIKSEFVDAPVIKELHVCLECRMKSYDKESCRLVGEIINVSVDEAALTDNMPDIKKFRPVIYDPATHDYYGFGAKAGKAFVEGKALK